MPSIGYKQTPEHIEKLRRAHTGQKRTLEQRKKMSDAHKKNPVNYWLGKKRSELTKKKISKTKIQNPTRYWLGKKMSDEHRLKNSIAHTGENSPRWIKDRNLLKKSDDRSRDVANKEWRKQVKERDGYKCKINNMWCLGQIEVHHILPWRDYPESRYDVNNGITLCKYHHPRKYKEESRLSDYFNELLITNTYYF